MIPAIALMAAVTFSLVLYVNGGLTGFSLWNAIPICVALIALLVDKSMKGLRYAIYGFSCTIIAVVFAVHLAYLEGVVRILSTASVPVRKLYGLPLYAIAAGYAVGILGAILGAVHDEKHAQRSDRSR